MVEGDEFYQESLNGFSKKAEHKICNLMAHKYQLRKPEKVTLLVDQVAQFELKRFSVPSSTPTEADDIALRFCY